MLLAAAPLLDFRERRHRALTVLEFLRKSLRDFREFFLTDQQLLLRLAHFAEFEIFF